MPTFEQAIVKTGGKQYRVEPGAVLRVEKLTADIGATIELGEVLLLGKGDDAQVGAPLIAGAKVSATIKSHGRGKKVIVYKFKRRKNYRRKQGHRQSYTELKIGEISFTA
jgi:large subunit ribosomal protein L21